MMKNKWIFSIFLTLGISLVTVAQQEITVEVSPTISKSIKGEKILNRDKYFNLASNVSELNDKLSTDQFQNYMEELEMTVGRGLYMVRAEVSWGDDVREDASRSGFADIDYLESQKNPSDNGLQEYETLFGERQGLAVHDGHNAYPDFMDLYTFENSNNQYMPGNTDAAAELAANLLKFKYTDFQRPSFFEPVNEPHWKFWSDSRFTDLHTKTNDLVDELELDVNIGGPCYSVSNFYKQEYSSLGQITGFIDRTNFELDFYSFHSYDYMRWDDEAWDFEGGISSGLPLEGVIDAIAAHTYNTYDQEFKFVGSEHGGYIFDGTNRNHALDTLSGMHFPGEGFDFEMQRRTIANFVSVNSAIANTMTYMNHPHIVQKAVPFILLETSSWDPYYYASLLVKEDFDASSTVYHEARLVDYYKFFKDVRGRRVESHCFDPDVQHFAFVDEKNLVLLFHNQSNTNGNINLDIDDISNPVNQIMIRRLGRNEDFTPDFSEETISSLENITIGAQESIALFVSYTNDIAEEEERNEEIFYSSSWGTQFSNARTFPITLPENRAVISAKLRVGISRNASKGKEVEIQVNGTNVEVPFEDCADRITSDVYATTKVIKLDPALLEMNNTVRVAFADGGSGGVGAVVIRAVLEDYNSVENNQEDILNLDIYPNPGSSVLNIKNGAPGLIEILDLSGNTILSEITEKEITQVAIQNIKQGAYIVKFTSGRHVLINKLSIL